MNNPATMDLDPSLFEGLDFDEFSTFNWNAIDNYEQDAINILSEDSFLLEDSAYANPYVYVLSNIVLNQFLLHIL